MLSIRDFGVIFTVVILIGFYVPLSTYYVWQLYSKAYRIKAMTFHSAVFLRQRYSSFSLIAAVAYIIQFIDLSIWIFVYSDIYNKASLQNTLISIASTIHIITQFIITSCLTLRFWLINFRIKFEMMSENHEWKKIINSNYQKDEQNNIEHAMFSMMNNMQNTVNSTEWILKHKSTFGNHRWCFKRALIIFLLLLSMIIFNESVNHSKSLSSQIIMEWITILFAFIIYATFGILWSILLFLHCRSPRFSDSIFIKNELGYIIQTMMFFLLVYIIFLAVFGLGIRYIFIFIYNIIYTYNNFMDTLYIYTVQAMYTNHIILKK